MNTSRGITWLHAGSTLTTISTGKPMDKIPTKTYFKFHLKTFRDEVLPYFGRDEIAKRSIRITIKKNLSGHISVVQNNVTLAKSDNTATLQTKVMSKFQVHLYDPEGEKKFM